MNKDVPTTADNNTVQYIKDGDPLYFIPQAAKAQGEGYEDG